MPPEHAESPPKGNADLSNSTNGTSAQHQESEDSALFPCVPPGSESAEFERASIPSFDPQAVFEASLEFQNSQLPLPKDLDKRRSSSSLYPSLESVSRVNDDADLESSWAAGTKAASRKSEPQKMPAAAVASAVETTPFATAQSSQPAARRISYSPDEHNNTLGVASAQAISQYPSVASLPSHSNYAAASASRTHDCMCAYFVCLFAC